VTKLPDAATAQENGRLSPTQPLSQLRVVLITDYNPGSDLRKPSLAQFVFERSESCFHVQVLPTAPSPF
jgi:hypothetical protein